MIASSRGKRLPIQAFRVSDGRLVSGGTGPPLVLLLSFTNDAAAPFAIFKYGAANIIGLGYGATV